MEEHFKFELRAPWPLSADQKDAVAKLVDAYKNGQCHSQTLLGVTGSGKTFTMANVITQLQRPTLVMAHNKTLAAQLYSEFKEFFPANAVHYFVSYYDYYQPEAYMPAQDIYIEKDASINERIEKLRLATTKALIERRDVIVVASVSCIYGLGKRKNYEDAIFRFSVGDIWERKGFMMRLLENYYQRNDIALTPGNFRVRGDIIELYPAYSDTALRIAFFDNEIERIDEIDPVSGKSIQMKNHSAIFPARHYVTTSDAIETAKGAIEAEMREQISAFEREKRYLEAQRIKMRTDYDMEMLTEVGYCSGIENYSRFLDGRKPGETPGTLMDFFPEDYLLFLDESHMTIPQIRGMYNGDRARKMTLVDHGFRLPSCLDNRPLKWDEFAEKMTTVLFISATPGDFELQNSSQIVEQLVRPTGIPDPEIEIHPASMQIDHLVGELNSVVSVGQRALVTTLTKRSAEDLAEYLASLGIKVRYIHSELDAFERAELLRDLRLGVYSVLVGVNLLREGIDLPEVALVAILEADREGYLRSHRSLIQMIGRAARNEAGRVILYADTITESIEKTIRETTRRREYQIKYNDEHGIVPRTILKEVRHLLPEELLEDKNTPNLRVASPGKNEDSFTIKELEVQMWDAVEKLDFEKAAELRDIISAISDKGGSNFGTMDKSIGSKTTQSKKYRRRHTKK